MRIRQRLFRAKRHDWNVQRPAFPPLDVGIMFLLKVGACEVANPQQNDKNNEINQIFHGLLHPHCRAIGKQLRRALGNRRGSKADIDDGIGSLLRRLLTHPIGSFLAGLLQ